MDKKEEFILVAEDSPPNLKILCHYIKLYGFKTIECEDGAIALEHLKSQPEQNIVAIFSDLMMPNLDGLGLLKGLRELEDSPHVNTPFVFISAVLDGDQVMEAMELGIKDYLLKPVTKDKVEEKLSELFPDRKFELPQKK